MDAADNRIAMVDSMVGKITYARLVHGLPVDNLNLAGFISIKVSSKIDDLVKFI